MFPGRRLFPFLYIISLFLILGSCQCSKTLYPKTVGSNKHMHYSLYVSKEFDADEVKLIDEAAREWENKTDGMVEYSIYYNWDDKYSDMPRYHTIAFVKVSQWDEFTKKYLDSWKDGKWNRILGMYDTNHSRPTIYLVVDRALGEVYLKRTILHEIGHSLRCNHLETLDAIMYPSTEMSTANSLTKNDLKEFCRANHCNAEKLIQHQQKF